jgi:Protein of unknown function (DUF2806)
MAEKPLIDLGGITKPATVLIERVCDAIGAVAKPWQARRIARTEAAVDFIKAQSRIEISDLEERTLRRVLHEESQKQEAIEAVTAQAIPLVGETARPDLIDRDWLTHFFDRCSLTSDEQMRLVWAHILAGNANAPGSFSKRTLDLVASLEKEDARVIQKLANFSIFISDYDDGQQIVEPQPIVFPTALHRTERSSEEMTFNELHHLASLGIITFETEATFRRTFSSDVLSFEYGSRLYNVHGGPGKAADVEVFHVLYTKAGEELARIMVRDEIDGYMLRLCSEWITAGHVVSCTV